MEATHGTSTSTGASTPVAVKIKRIEKRDKKDQGPSGNQFQPTLRSFMDLKGGLVGARGRPGNQQPGKHTRAGRDPSAVSQGDNLLLFGEAAEGKDFKAGGSQESEETDRNKEGRSVTQRQGFTISGSRPRQGKVVASRKEALECMIVRGAEGKERKSKGNKK